MKITSLELVRYRRMMLNNFTSFTIRPQEIIQLILGTNGCGKSSLLNELTPLPPSKDDFEPGGSKTIRITHRGNNYVLKSTFSPSPKHSFIKNDEPEMNPGGTVTAQKELVKQEFRITPQIHNLLIEGERFHRMDAARRREWFTLLSDVNYDFALGLYWELKSDSNAFSSALKLAKKHYVTESAKVISPEEEKKLKLEVEHTHRELNMLIEQRAPLDNPVAFYEKEQADALAELNKCSMILLRTKLVAPYVVDTAHQERDEWGELHHPVISSIADVEVIIQEFRHQVSTKEALVNKAISEHNKLKETHSLLLKTGEAGVAEIQERIRLIEEEIISILTKRKLQLDRNDQVNNAVALETVYETLATTFNTLPDNSDKKYSQLRLNELRNTLLTTKDSMAKMSSDLILLNNQKAKMEAHRSNGDINCPKCHYQWTIGYDDKKYNELLDIISAKEKEVAVIGLTVTQIESSITGIKEYGDLYKEFVRCVQNWPTLQVFWNYLIGGEYVINAPRKALSILESYRHDLSLESEVLMIEKKRDELRSLLDSAAKVGDSKLFEVKNKLEERRLLVEELTFEIIQLRKTLGEYENYKQQLNEAHNLSDKISRLVAKATQANKNSIEMLRRDTINHCVRQLQHALARKEETLAAVNLQAGIVGDLKIQIDRLTLQAEASKALVQQLSPTDGLIAEGLLGFIRSFTAKMNNIIRKVWSYPLVIMDCGTSGSLGVELDYKFPLMVQSKTNIKKDVSEGSTGMQEIIDLAFKVVAMKCLGLSESPLYLDEFGKGFDKAHRSSCTPMIKSLMDSQDFTQLFMISHYVDGYGAFTNSEVCVIDSRNITTPQIYNTHVTIH